MDHLQRVVKWLPVAALAVAATAAQAQLSGGGYSLTQQSNGVDISYAGTQSAVPGSDVRTELKTSTGATITDKVGGISGPTGTMAVTAGITVARAIPWSVAGRAVASGIASCGGLLPCTAGVAVATGIFIAADYYRARNAVHTDHPERQGIQWDPGTSPVTTSQSVWKVHTLYGGPVADYFGSTKSEACTAAGATRTVPANSDGMVRSNAHGYMGTEATPVCHMGYDEQRSPCNAPYTASQCLLHFVESDTETPTATTNTVTQCPGYIDPLDPANSRAAGYAEVGVDGKCPTGRYSQSNEQAIADLAATNSSAMTQAGKDKVYAGFLEWLHSGYPCSGCPADSPWAITLPTPATITATPITTTTSTSSAVTTSTKTDSYPLTQATSLSPTNNRYGIIRWGKTTTTTNSVQNIDANGANVGAPSVTTTVTGTPSTAAAEAKAAAVADAVTMCDKNPESSACAVLGQAPTAEAIPTNTVDVTVTPDSGWGASTGSCPAVIQTSSIGAVDPFGLMCTYANGLRPVIIGAAWIFGALIFLGRAD